MNPDWEYWGLYKAKARQAVVAIVGFVPEDLDLDVALRMIESGHAATVQHAQWRAFDVIRERLRFAPILTGDLEEEIDSAPSPEFMAYLSERMSGGPFRPYEDPDPYLVAMTPAQFFKRWG